MLAKKKLTFKKIFSYKYALTIMLFAFLLSYLSTAQSETTNYKGKLSPNFKTQTYKPNEILVQYKSSPEIKVIKLSPSTSVESAVANYKARSDVKYAEPNYSVKALYTPSDNWFSEQWGLRNTGQLIDGLNGIEGDDIDISRAWDIEKGNSNPVTIAVLDTGIDVSHPDLMNSIWTNTDEIDGNGVDDDNNGYVDDRNGYNFSGIGQSLQEDSFDLGPALSQGIAQSITGTGQKLTHFGLLIARVEIPATDINVTVREDSDNDDNLDDGTVPGDEDNIVSTTKIYRYQIGEGFYNEGDEITEVYRELDAPVTLQNGRKYFIILTVDTVVSNGYTVLSTQEDPYVEGEAWTYNGAFWMQGSSDLYFVTNPQGNTHDDMGHGTHVSGIAAADSNDQAPGVKSIAGISQGASIMPVKVLDSSGVGYTLTVRDGINYAVENGADIINMSLGGPYNSSLIQEAINNAYKKGVTVIAAAGNSGDSSMSYPAGNDNVIGVGATNNNDDLASFSTYNGSVDVTAPGVGIVSAFPIYNVYLKNFGYTNIPSYGNYDFMSGTSTASPMAAGTAALVKSLHPSYSPAQIEASLRLAEDLGPKGRDDSYGYGRINAYKALLGDSVKPSRPQIYSYTHPTSFAYYTNDDPFFEWNATDNSGIKGYSYTLNQKRSTNPTGFKSAGNIKRYRNIKSGKWYFHVRAIDLFNNYGPTGRISINIDKYKPRTFAPLSAKVVRGSNTKIYYKVSDPYTGGRAFVRIIVRRGNTTYALSDWFYTKINKLSYVKFRSTMVTLTLPAGAYKFYIYAYDLAGNKQNNVARNTLMVFDPPTRDDNKGDDDKDKGPLPSPLPLSIKSKSSRSDLKLSNKFD